MNTVFGVNCNTLQNKDNEYRYWGKQVFEPHTFKNAIGFFAPQILHFFSIPFNDVGVQKFFITVFENTVKHRLNNNIKCHDFMDLIIQLMKKGFVNEDNELTSQSIPGNNFLLFQVQRFNFIKNSSLAISKVFFGVLRRTFKK